MGEQADGSGAALRAQDLSDDDSAEPPRRDEGAPPGFFSRILSALGQSPDTTPDKPSDAAAMADRRAAMNLPGISNLRRLRVDDISVPKAEIIAVPVEITKDALVAVFRDSGFSRLPVYSETLDKPLGLVLLKDLALEFGFSAGQAPFALQKMLRPLLFAPPSMPLAVLLQKMQTERTHMALVIDEYGGVDGLVTIENLIEQVIGEIDDEHDEAEGGLWVLEKPGVYLAQARAPLEAFSDAIGVRLTGADDDEEIDTLGGLLFVLTGRVPARGEVVRHASGVEFEVVDADPRRVKRMRVRLPGGVGAPAMDEPAGNAAQGLAKDEPGHRA